MIALVGPLCSIFLGILFLGLSFALEPLSIHIAVMMSWLFLMNMAVGIFNLIPGFPLDGGRVFRAFVWAVSGNYASATRIATIGGQVTAIAFAAIGVCIYIIWQHDMLRGMWMGFIGLFLWQAASANFRQFQQLQRVQGMLVVDLMSTDCNEVSRGILVSDLIDSGLLPNDRSCCVITEDRRIEGFINLAVLKKVSKRAMASTMAEDVMVPLGDVAHISTEEDSISVMEILEEEILGVVAVVDIEAKDDGDVIGVVTREHLLELMRTPVDSAG